MNSSLVFLAAILILLGAAHLIWAAPDGVTIVPISNSTRTSVAGGEVNTSGGSITTMNLNGTSQNLRWKAFVGNVTGRLTLDDAVGATIYDWGISTISGEVYASRSSTNVNWSGIGCATLNITEHENRFLNHTNIDDNITTTFVANSHSNIFVGTVELAPNSCPSARTYVNDSSQATNFEEVVLYDLNGTGYNTSDNADGRIVYTTIIENDIYGYNNETYDFQMIVPERGEDTWGSSTAYYFYVELS